MEPDIGFAVVDREQGSEGRQVLPTFVIELIHDKELMSKYAPAYDYADLLERYPKPKPKLAA